MLEDHKIKNNIIRRFKDYDILLEKINLLKKFNLDCKKEETELVELKRILTGLPQFHRECFILHVIKQEPIENIALEYNVSRNVVRHKISEVYHIIE